MATAAGVPAHRLILHGNNKSDAEHFVYASNGASAGSSSTPSMRSSASETLVPNIDGAVPPRVLVRITPGVEAHTHEFVMTGQEDSKFGFSLANGAAAAAVEALRRLQRPSSWSGSTLHIGSQIFAAESFAKEVEVLALFTVTGAGVPELCVGGGLGVPYVGGEEALSDQGVGRRRVVQACADFGIPSTVRV